MSQAISIVAVCDILSSDVCVPNLCSLRAWLNLLSYTSIHPSFSGESYQCETLQGVLYGLCTADVNTQEAIYM